MCTSLRIIVINNTSENIFGKKINLSYMFKATHVDTQLHVAMFFSKEKIYIILYHYVNMATVIIGKYWYFSTVPYIWTGYFTHCISYHPGRLV